MPDTTPQNSQAPPQPKQAIDILVHIELLGTPNDAAFAALDAGMTARKWLTTLTTDDGDPLPLPAGTYSGQSEVAVSDLSQQIHDWITAAVWQQGAIVLVNELAAWSIAGD
jgi:hypothetical protein